MGLGGSNKRKREGPEEPVPASKKAKITYSPDLYNAVAADNLKEAIALLRSKKYDHTINQRFGEEQDTALLQAARNGNLGIVCALLSKGADAAQLDSSGWSALHSVVTDETGCQVVKSLLQLAPQLLNLADRDGWNPLMISAQEENLNTVKLLLSEGADATIADEKGRVTLHWAAGSESAKLVEVVLNAWPSALNEKDVEGRTPMIVAAQSGGVEVVKFLKEKGADLKWKDASGRTAVDYAKEEERDEIVDVLLEVEEESEKKPGVESSKEAPKQAKPEESLKEAKAEEAAKTEEAAKAPAASESTAEALEVKAVSG